MFVSCKNRVEKIPIHPMKKVTFYGPVMPTRGESMKSVGVCTSRRKTPTTNSQHCNNLHYTKVKPSIGPEGQARPHSKTNVPGTLPMTRMHCNHVKSTVNRTSNNLKTRSGLCTGRYPGCNTRQGSNVLVTSIRSSPRGRNEGKKVHHISDDLPEISVVDVNWNPSSDSHNYDNTTKLLKPKKTKIEPKKMVKFADVVHSKDFNNDALPIRLRSRKTSQGSCRQSKYGVTSHSPNTSENTNPDNRSNDELFHGSNHKLSRTHQLPSPLLAEEASSSHYKHSGQRSKPYNSSSHCTMLHHNLSDTIDIKNYENNKESYRRYFDKSNMQFERLADEQYPKKCRETFLSLHSELDKDTIQPTLKPLSDEYICQPNEQESNLHSAATMDLLNEINKYKEHEICNYCLKYNKHGNITSNLPHSTRCDHDEAFTRTHPHKIDDEMCECGSICSRKCMRNIASNSCGSNTFSNRNNLENITRKTNESDLYSTRSNQPNLNCNTCHTRSIPPNLTCNTRCNPPNLTCNTCPTRSNPPNLTCNTCPTKSIPPNLTCNTCPTRSNPPNLTSNTYQTRSNPPNLTSNTYQTRCNPPNLTCNTCPTRTTPPNLTSNTCRTRCNPPNLTCNTSNTFSSRNCPLNKFCDSETCPTKSCLQRKACKTYDDDTISTDNHLRNKEDIHKLSHSHDCCYDSIDSMCTRLCKNKLATCGHKTTQFNNHSCRRRNIDKLLPKKYIPYEPKTDIVRDLKNKLEKEYQDYNPGHKDQIESFTNKWRSWKCEELQDVRDLRERYKENDDSLPKHKCIHRYTQNERLFLEPTVSDNHGRSLCTDCGSHQRSSNTKDDYLYHITLGGPRVLDKPSKENKSQNFRTSNENLVEKYTVGNNTTDIYKENVGSLPPKLTRSRSNINEASKSLLSKLAKSNLSGLYPGGEAKYNNSYKSDRISSNLRSSKSHRKRDPSRSMALLDHLP